MSTGGWWWPGFLIEFAIFLTLICGFTWWFSLWAVRHMDKHFDERWEEAQRIRNANLPPVSPDSSELSEQTDVDPEEVEDGPGSDQRNQ